MKQFPQNRQQPDLPENFSGAVPDIPPVPGYTPPNNSFLLGAAREEIECEHDGIYDTNLAYTTKTCITSYWTYFTRVEDCDRCDVPSESSKPFNRLLNPLPVRVCPKFKNHAHPPHRLQSSKFVDVLYRHTCTDIMSVTWN